MPHISDTAKRSRMTLWRLARGGSAIPPPSHGANGYLVSELATLMGVSRGTVLRWVTQKRLPVRRTTACFVIPVEAARRFAKGEIEPQEAAP